MKRLGLFLLLAPFLTACIADNDYYASNVHYHQVPVNKTHAHVHGNPRYYPRSAARPEPHQHNNHSNHQQYANTRNKASIHPDNRNITAHGHD